MTKSSKLFILLLIVLAAGSIVVVSVSHPGKKTTITPENTNTTKDVWSEIVNTTYRKDDNFAGEGYVFFEDTKGVKRVIHQKYGSGVYVVSSDYPGIAVVDANRIQINDDVYEYRDGKLISGTTTLTLGDRKPVVYSRSGPVDIEIVKSESFDIQTLSK